MRKFIISDIHGFGNVYYAMMKYLDNINKEEEIELYINGDLIDRGFESADVLLDVIKRIEDNKFKIVYLGGNHELLMYDVFDKRKNNIRVPFFNDWYENGGYVTDDTLADKFGEDKEKLYEVANFVSNLKIYHKFKEKILNKPIILVHAAIPKGAINNKDMKIKDNNSETFYAVWTREHSITYLLGCEFVDPHEERIGYEDYFTIIGHTPTDNKYGFEYHKKQNYLNIDGGCAPYVSGYFDYNHFPLVEVCEGYLKILTFNSNNEIIYGNYFNGKKIIPYKKSELVEARKYLDNTVKIKKLSINEDGLVGYWH